MLGVVVTSFSLYNLTGRLSPFHGAALISAITIAVGMWTVLRRRPRVNWIEAHATWMAWSYLGLCGAAVAESLTRVAMPVLQRQGVLDGRWGLFWTLVAVGSASVFIVGGPMIRRKLPASVAKTPAAMRAEREALEPTTHREEPELA